MKHHAILLTWRDSCREGGWTDLRNPENHKVAIITTIGWLVREDRKSLTVTTSISDHGSAMDQLTIPLDCIVKRKRLPQFITGD